MRITKKDLKKFILEELAAKTQKPLSFDESDPSFVGPPQHLQEMEAWYTPEEKEYLRQKEIERIESDPSFVGPPQSARGSRSKVPVWDRDEPSDEERIAALLQRSAALRSASEDLLDRPRLMPSEKEMRRLEKEWGESEGR